MKEAPVPFCRNSENQDGHGQGARCKWLLSILNNICIELIALAQSNGERLTIKVPLQTRNPSPLPNLHPSHYSHYRQVMVPLDLNNGYSKSPHDASFAEEFDSSDLC